MDESIWSLAMVEGCFSGFPSIELDRKDLKALRDAIDLELNWNTGEEQMWKR